MSSLLWVFFCVVFYLGIIYINLIMKAIFPGSFNPIHNGHIEIIKYASTQYEHLYVLVAQNELKNANRTLEFRKQMIIKSLVKFNLKNVTVITQRPGILTADIAKDMDIEIIIRGIRQRKPTKYEEDLAEKYLDRNELLSFHYIIIPGMEDISSSIINERTINNGSLNGLIPNEIQKDLIIGNCDNHKKGKLVIFCGPSGSGKGTIEKNFINNSKYNLHFSISATTRPKRSGEKDGVNYHFLTRKTFKSWIKNDYFLEYAFFADHYYGTPIAAVQQNLNAGNNVFLEIEVQGVRQVIKKNPEAITIFLSPPSLEVLKERLIKRGTESEAIINERIKIAEKEILLANDKKLFKYNVINNDIFVASKEVIKILEENLNV